MRTKKHSRRGFSLVEVALALLIVSVGLLATVGMLPGGLDNSRKASDDTQQALFADYVLNTLRALAANTNYPWASFSTGTPATPIPVAASSMWDSPGGLLITPDVVGTIGTYGTWKTLSFRAQANSAIEEIKLAYSLTIEPVDPASDNMRRAVLRTQINSQNNTNTLKVFFADIYRGDLQP